MGCARITVLLIQFFLFIFDSYKNQKPEVLLRFESIEVNSTAYYTWQ